MLINTVQPAIVLPGLRIDLTNPLTKDLSYFRSFADGLLPFPSYALEQNIAETPTASDVTTTTGPVGVGMTGTSAASFFGMSNNSVYTLPSSCTVLAYVRANFSPTDGVTHIIFNYSNLGGNSFYALYKDSTNVWFNGKFDSGTDARVSASSSGTYNTGDSFVVGGYAKAGTTNVSLFVKGVKLASASSVNDAGHAIQPEFEIGGGSATTSWWQTSNQNIIYWIGIWERLLTDNEIFFISQYPMAFFKNSSTESHLVAAGTATSSIKFRRTLSGLGTRIGSRQNQGYMNG